MPSGSWIPGLRGSRPGGERALAVMAELILRYRTLGAFVVYFALVFLWLFADRQGTHRQLGAVSSTSLRLGAAAETAAAAGVLNVARFWERYVHLIHVERENEHLRRELDRLREENARLVGVMQENARLRAMVGFREANPAMELLPARVTSRDVTSYFRVTRLHLWVDDPRVHPGLPVVSSAGLVGQITEVHGRTASVLLAVDARSSVDVIVQRNRARGVLQGVGYDNAYTSRLAYLLRRERVEEGDVVVTSGQGGRFPPDLLVGRIVRVDHQSQGLFQDVHVEPAVDFGRLEEVYVLLQSER